MGDADFRSAISYFLHKHAFQPVDTHDLENAIMESTGQNLDWFFEQWVYRAGHPVFDVNYQWNESAQKVVLQVNQTQQISDRVPVFQTPVVIGITRLPESIPTAYGFASKRSILKFNVRRNLYW